MGSLITLPDRVEFLGLPWEEQRGPRFLALFAKGTAHYLKATCVNPTHADDEMSMTIYGNGVYCYGCKARWWPDEFVMDLGDAPLVVQRHRKPKADRPQFIPMSEVETFHRWLCRPDGWRHDRLEAMYARGLRLDTLQANYIGHTGDAFVIPVLGLDQKTVLSLRYRRDDDLETDRPKYWGTPGANDVMFYMPFIPNDVTPRDPNSLFLCEGELDALRLAQEGFAGISLTNGCNAMKPEHAKVLKALTGKGTLLVCYDQDDPGRKAALHVNSLLHDQDVDVRVVRWPISLGKDVTEFLLRHSAESYVKYARNATWAG